MVGRPGEYTRKRGLDRDTNKALIFDHLKRNRKAGSPLSDLQDVLPGLSTKQIQHLLAEMKQDGQVHVIGMTKGARWYPGPEADDGGES
jgi:ATP-dependent DNA helicase RecG